MRSLPALLLVALLALPPVASARADLSVDAPQGPVSLVPGEAATMPIFVHVRLEDAACPDDATLTVRLVASTVEGMHATLPSEVQVRVPHGFYMRDAFEGEASADLTLLADAPGEGQVNVQATLEPTNDCTIMGEASAQATAHVAYAAQKTAATEAPTPPSPAPVVPSRPTPSEAPLLRGPPVSSGVAAAPRDAPSILVPLLGVGVVGLIFFALGRLGKADKLRGDEE